MSEPMYRRLSPEEQAIVEAADLFNDSAYRRTIAGIAKSLGDARVSLLPLSGVNPEVVITVAWDISWYQYRVSPESPQHVRLAERGYELDDLDPRFTSGTATSAATAASRRTSHACSSHGRMPINGDDDLLRDPPGLEAELYAKLVEHYKDNPNVEVIVDPRSGPDRRSEAADPAGRKADIRDRRRARPGAFRRRIPRELTRARGPEPQHGDHAQGGPGARNANAQRQPTASAKNGRSQIVATVSVKPTASCIVSAVPT